MKRCSTCKEVKTLDLFCKNRAQKDGMNNACKACASVRQKNRQYRFPGVRIVYDLPASRRYKGLTLEQEKELLTKIKKGDEELLADFILSFQGFIHWTARKYKHTFDNREHYADFVNAMNDKLVDLILKLIKKPERRNVGWRSKKPALNSHLVSTIQGSAKEYIEHFVMGKNIARGKHMILPDKILTEEERMDIISSNLSVYELARRFNRTYDCIRGIKKYWDTKADPEKYRKHLDRLKEWKRKNRAKNKKVHL